MKHNTLICDECEYWFQSDDRLNLAEEILHHQQEDHKGYEYKIRVHGRQKEPTSVE